MRAFGEHFQAALRLVIVLVALATTTWAHAQSFSLTATPLSGTQVQLTWTGMDLPVTIYRNGQSVGSTGYYSSSFTDGGLANGTTYTYQAVGANFNEGTWDYYYSNTTSATTYAPPNAPGSLGATTVSGTQVNISWSDTSGNEENVIIERKVGAGGSYSHVATVGANVTSHSSTGLSNGTTYYFRVRATNWVGSSGYSNEAATTTFAPPAAPTGLGASAGAGAQATLTWTDASTTETGFKIERKTGVGGTYAQVATVGANVVTYVESGLVPGTYYYRVRATNATGDSGSSNEANVSFVLPAPPSNLLAIDLPAGQIRLMWVDNSDGETGFKLERKVGAVGEYSQLAAPAANATTHDDSGIAAGTVYFYRVRATNFAGDSSYSNEISITGTLPNVTAGTVSYEYDAFGNLKKTNAGGAITTLTYDRRGRKRSMSDPDMGAWTYDYNALGELIRQTDAKSIVTTMQYDLLGRLVNRTEADLVSTWTYDSCTKGVGKLCQAASDNSYQRTHGYDGLGRPSTVTAVIDTTYTVTTTYDSLGRADTVTYPTGFAVQNVYNAFGYLSQTRDAAAPSVVFWSASTVSASGKVLAEALGNGLTTTKQYDVLDRLKEIKVEGTGGTPQHNKYEYDVISNLVQREDVTQNLTETFAYDSLNRLVSASGPGLTTKAYDYDAIGNIVYRSDVGTYTYGGARPHAVTSVSGTVNASYSYDANGNLTTGNGRTLTYTSFNMPATIAGNGHTYTYTYNPEHERVRLVHSSLGTFIYVHPSGAGSLLYEKEIKPSGLTEHKHYISSVKGLAGVYISRSDSTTEMRYFHQDNLGSIQVITNASGAVLERLAYEPFGKRRFPSGPDDPNNGILGVLTDRGFTSHEHLDEVALIHMNGRVYDPIIGRFLTPDPFVQFAGNLQSYNRYSYAMNAPMRGWDPSGYSLTSFFVDAVDDTLGVVARGIGNGFDSAERRCNCQPIRIALAVVAAVVFGQIEPSLGVAVGAYVASGGDFNAGVRAGLTSLLFTWVGGQGFEVGSWQSVAAHAAAGCVSGELNGGDCRSGALASGFAEAALGNVTLNNPVGQLAARTVVGGTVSVLGGGSFANGAKTAAYAYIFNHMMHGDCGATLADCWSNITEFASDVWDRLATPTPMCAGGCVTGTPPAAGPARGGALAGVRAEPRNLAEKLTLDEAKAGAGQRIMQGKIGDPRYSEDAWAKMQHVHQTPSGQNIVIHYWNRLVDGVRTGFKFKD